MNKTFYIKDRRDLESKKKAIWSAMLDYCVAPFCLKLTDIIRTYEQNAKMWPMLTDISEQREFNSKLRSTNEWKTILMSAWMTAVKKMVPNIHIGLEGEVLVLNEFKTSAMSKKDFCDFIEYIYYFGSENDVKWSEKACNAYDTYKEIYQ